MANSTGVAARQAIAVHPCPVRSHNESRHPCSLRLWRRRPASPLPLVRNGGKCWIAGDGTGLERQQEIGAAPGLMPDAARFLATTNWRCICQSPRAK